MPSDIVPLQTAPLSLEETSFDAIVLGTSLPQSIAAAALAKDGQTVLHLDRESVYGSNRASLTLPDLGQWARARHAWSKEEVSAGVYEGNAGKATSGISCYIQGEKVLPEDIPGHITSCDKLKESPSSYNLDLLPQLLPSSGDVVEWLIASDAANYVEFKLLEASYLRTPAGEDGLPSTWQKVPGTKEAIFADRSLTLIEKRLLMRYFTSIEALAEELAAPEGKAKGEGSFAEFIRTKHRLPPHLLHILQYAVLTDDAVDPQDLSLAEAMRRTLLYLRSVGRYGKSPFLYPLYGMGDIIQAFCRVAAVHGAIYATQRRAEVPSSTEITLPDSSEGLEAKVVVAHPLYLRDRGSEGKRVRRAICIIDHEEKVKVATVDEEGKEAVEEAEMMEPGLPRLFIIPPAREGSPPVYILGLGVASHTSPKGKVALHVMHVSEEGVGEELMLEAIAVVGEFYGHAALTPASATLSLSWIESNAPTASPILWSVEGNPLSALEPLLKRPAFAQDEEDKDDEAQEAVEDGEGEGEANPSAQS